MSRFTTESFLEANRRSPVVYASVTERGGCFYRLADGKTFTLTPTDCKRIAGSLRWPFMADEELAA